MYIYTYICVHVYVHVVCIHIYSEETLCKIMKLSVVLNSYKTIIITNLLHVVTLIPQDFFKDTHEIYIYYICINPCNLIRLDHF